MLYFIHEGEFLRWGFNVKRVPGKWWAVSLLVPLWTVTEDHEDFDTMNWHVGCQRRRAAKFSVRHRQHGYCDDMRRWLFGFDRAKRCIRQMEVISYESRVS